MRKRWKGNNINEAVDRRVSESRSALMWLYRENSDLGKGKIISEKKELSLITRSYQREGEMMQKIGQVEKNR